MGIVACKKCGKLKPHEAKGFCKSCYNHFREKARPDFVCPKCKQIKKPYLRGLCRTCYIQEPDVKEKRKLDRKRYRQLKKVKYVMNQTKESDLERHVRITLQILKEEFELQKEIRGLDGDNADYRVADFYLPKRNVYIEVFGGWNNLEYQKKAKYKIYLYKRNKIRFFPVFPNNAVCLEDYLRNKIKEISEQHVRQDLIRENKLIFNYLEKQGPDTIELPNKIEEKESENFSTLKKYSPSKYWVEEPFKVNTDKIQEVKPKDIKEVGETSISILELTKNAFNWAKNKILKEELRKRGTAIVESEKGILVVADEHKTFVLPGGRAKRKESRKKATIRELREETGLKAISSKYLFSIRTRQNHKVFFVKVKGKPKPRYEVKYIHWWNRDSNVKISKGTKTIIEKYLAEKQ